MAKKGQQVQLQAELSTDEEWEKFLGKDGLLVIDVYSDWCGPCSGMAANLKKIKLEHGGDLLQLAIAKSDGIQQLERFRGRSEPTWLFISKGVKVNLLFGCNAPKLTRLLIDEIKKEEQAASGEKPREHFSDINELDEVEIERQEAADALVKAAKEKEEAKRAKEFRDRKVAECANILENLPSVGTILVFPSGRDKYRDALDDVMKEASVLATQTEKINLTEEQLEEMFYFEESRDGEPIFDGYSLHNLLESQCLLLAVKPTHGAEIENIDDLVLEMVYGPLKRPPGSEDSAYRKLLSEAEDAETGEKIMLTGIWAPSVQCVRATILRMFFPKMSAAFVFPEPEPEPEHLALVFDTRKIREALHVMSQWSEQIMHYGFFTKEDPEDTELVAKSVQRLEKPSNRDKRTFEEKLVIQVSKKKSECVLAFAQVGPAYISPNSEEGAKECELFFPDDYAESLTEEEQVFTEDIEPEPSAAEEVQQEEEEEEAEQEAEDEMDEEGLEEEIDMDMFMFDVKITKEIIEEIFYFCEEKLSTKSVEDMLNGKVSLALLLKRNGENLPGEIDDMALQIVYGNSRQPPGDENSPCRQFTIKKDGDEDEDNIVTGIWAPPDKMTRALVLKYLFPNLTAPFRFPDVEPPPFYVAVAYDAFKTREVMELSDLYPGQVMMYGFFTNDKPSEAALISKTVTEFDERKTPTTYFSEEKIVIQLAKTNEECVLAFIELGPTYISADAEKGEADCKLFFPHGYNVPKEVIHEVKKKFKKKKAKAAVVNQEENTSTATSDLVKEQEELEHEDEEANSEDDRIECDILQEDHTGEEATEAGGTSARSAKEADKATSPISDSKAGE